MFSFRIFFLFLLLMPSMLMAQSNPDGREMKHHRKALQYYNASAFEDALKELDKALRINPSNIESLLLSGDIHSLRGDVLTAIESYKKAVSIDESFFPPALYILANLQFNSGLYRDCLPNYKKYLTYPKVKPIEQTRALKNIELAEFRIYATENPVPFEPVNLGSDVNGEGYEFVNYISADGERLYFTRRTPKGARKDEDFFIASKLNDSIWGSVAELGHPINTPGDEGAMCLSPDGQFLFYAACNRPDSYGSCDLYASRKTGDGWSEPQNLGPAVNTSFWESQPSFSPDGRTLYFVSNRPGGWGGSDIWITRLYDNGTWTKPENAGQVINTPEAERGPFIHPDGQTLYFSSKGHPGMGEGDIFMSRLNITGEWSKPANLGYPVNTAADEVTMVVDIQGRFAYISSAIDGGFGLTDIYRFSLPETVKPLAVTYMKGVVSDSISGAKLAADFVLTDLETGNEIARSRSNAANGEFLVCIPTDRMYALTVEKRGYLFYSAHFAIEGEAGIEKPHLRNILLKPVMKDEITILRNVFFETDSSRLLPVSRIELDKLFDFLKVNPQITIEISGHTDNSGSIPYNLELSKMRAESVYNYLAGKGISKSRLTFKGYGATKPVADNNTPEGKAANRRTEFRIISLTVPDN